jgi:hypothetical protein
MGRKCGCSGTSLIIAQCGLSIIFEESIDGERLITSRWLCISQDSVPSFEYKTPWIHLTPTDLEETKLARPKMLHFICSPSRALSIISKVNASWEPITIYEPIPVRWHSWFCWNPSDFFHHSKVCCVLEGLDELMFVLRLILIFRCVSPIDAFLAVNK